MVHLPESQKSSSPDGPRIVIPVKHTPAIPREGMSEREKEFVDKIAPATPTSPNPECAEWSVWFGKEVEGTIDVGEETLFIRNLGEKSFVEIVQEARKRNVERVFFTEEFNFWPTIRDALVYFPKVCKAHRIGEPFWAVGELPTISDDEIPADVVARCRMYWKMPIPPTLFIKDGDQICVGKSFNEEIFEAGTGKKCRPEQYKDDEKVL
jgi:hypothetical protein